jgi:hypothetical protein
MSFKIEESKFYQFHIATAAPPSDFVKRMAAPKRKATKAEIDLKLSKATVKRQILLKASKVRQNIEIINKFESRAQSEEQKHQETSHERLI